MWLGLVDRGISSSHSAFGGSDNVPKILDLDWGPNRIVRKERK